DGQNHLVGTLTLDGKKSIFKNDAWGRPTDVTESDSGGTTIAQSTYDYTDAGRLKSVDKRIDGSQTLQIRYAWDGGARTTGVAESGRAEHMDYDNAGRLQSQQVGAGDEQSVSTAFEQSNVSSHDGTLPQQVKKKEKSGSAYDLAVQY